MYFLGRDIVVYGKRGDQRVRRVAVGVILGLLAVSPLFLLFLWKYPKPEFTLSEAGLGGPARTRVLDKVFGYSEKGRPITGYEVGAGENVLLLFGAIHGNEMGTAELLERLVGDFRDIPGLLPTDKKLVVIPVINPDGYFERTDNLNANGVNLNLNFDTTYWQDRGPGGTYAGPRPFSEKESQVLKEVVNAYAPFVMLSFHSQGALISPEASDGSKKLAEWLAAKTGYEYYDGWDFAGTATRWFEESAGKTAVTVEISKDLASDWQRNVGALLDLVAMPGSHLPGESG